MCAAFSGDPGKKKCFAQSHKWHNGMCVFHARQVGCQPPQEPAPAEIILRAAGASKDLVDAMGESEEEAVKVKKDDQDSS